MPADATTLGHALRRGSAVRAPRTAPSGHDTILLADGIDAVAETIEHAAHEAAGEGMP